jgi:hypothetical protein
MTPEGRQFFAELIREEQGLPAREPEPFFNFENRTW